MEKKERVKKALGNLKEILLKKKLKINKPEASGCSLDLIKKHEEDFGMRYKIA